MNEEAIGASIDSLRNIFAIVLGLALSEAFKQFVVDKPVADDVDTKPIRWGGLPALLSFLLLLIPFFHGMARYLFAEYKHPPRPEPYGIWLLWDIIAFTAEAGLFFVMSRAIQWHQWRRFYWAVVVILSIDTVWGSVVWYAHRPEIIEWVLLNNFSLMVLLPVLLWQRPPLDRWAPLILVAGMFIRTGVDYWSSWDFYFPPAAVGTDAKEQSAKGTIYFAGPLFTQAEWQWNATLAESLRREGFQVILPQERAKPMVMGEEKFDAHRLFLDNVDGIERADVVVAVLDGADPDSGTCWEAGYAYKGAHPVLGVRTDLRTGGDDPKSAVNLMLSQGCKELLTIPLAKREDISWVTVHVAEAVQRLQQTTTKK